MALTFFSLIFFTLKFLLLFYSLDSVKMLTGPLSFWLKIEWLMLPKAVSWLRVVLKIMISYIFMIFKDFPFFQFLLFFSLLITYSHHWEVPYNSLFPCMLKINMVTEIMTQLMFSLLDNIINFHKKSFEWCIFVSFSRPLAQLRNNRPQWFSKVPLWTYLFNQYIFGLINLNRNWKKYIKFR